VSFEFIYLKLGVSSSVQPLYL